MHDLEIAGKVNSMPVDTSVVYQWVKRYINPRRGAPGGIFNDYMLVRMDTGKPLFWGRMPSNPYNDSTDASPFLYWIASGQHPKGIFKEEILEEIPGIKWGYEDGTSQCDCTPMKFVQGAGSVYRVNLRTSRNGYELRDWDEYVQAETLAIINQLMKDADQVGAHIAVFADYQPQWVVTLLAELGFTYSKLDGYNMYMYR